MLLIYTAALMTLALTRLLVALRTRRLEHRHARLVLAVRDLASTPTPKQGNNSRPDPSAQAKHQYLLGELTAKRDRLEDCYDKWQARTDRLSRALDRLRGWKGRGLPYLSGVVDSTLGLAGLTLGGVIQFPALSQMLTCLLGG